MSERNRIPTIRSMLFPRHAKYYCLGLRTLLPLFNFSKSLLNPNGTAHEPARQLVDSAMKTPQIIYECGSRASRLHLMALVAMLCFPALSSFGAVLIDLDARGLSEGPLATWTNTGTVLGDFTSAGTVVPQVTNVAGVNGVGFIGGTTGPNGTHYFGPIAPPSVTGGNSRTVEALVYDPSAQEDEQPVFAWGRRGGPDGSNVSFGHANNSGYGAVGHWGSNRFGRSRAGRSAARGYTTVDARHDLRLGQRTAKTIRNSECGGWGPLVR